MMDAPAKITPALPDLMQAVERANRWQEIARPIVKTIFGIEDAESALWAMDDYSMRTKALGCVQDAIADMRDMLDGIRDDSLADVTPAQPSSDDEQAWVDRDEWTAALADSVVSVADLIKQMATKA